MAVSATAAAILAGGRGQRLGGINKALIEIGGIRLIDRVGTALTGCEPVLVAVGRTPFAVDGLRAIPDLDSDYAGPLAGVAAAVAAIAGSPGVEWLLSVAVDTPYFPDDFRGRAEALTDGADVVLGCFGGQDYPTNALWRLAAIRDLPRNVIAGTAPHSLKRLAEGLRSIRLDYAAVVESDPFANVNTPEDLINLRSREGRMTRG